MQGNKLFAFWRYDTPPYLLGAEVVKVDKNGFVEALGYNGFKFKPVLIVPLEKGIKLNKKLKKAEAKYRRKMEEAKTELDLTVKEILN